MMIFASKTAVQPIQAYLEARYPGWNLDAALRYLPAATYLRDCGPRWTLDVGSGNAGLSRYANQRVVELDSSLPAGGASPFPSKRVRATATALPFRDRSIDAVVCLDLLEHIPEADRHRVLSELLRVAARHLVLGFPSGPQARRAEQVLNRLHRHKTGSSHPWLGEHLSLGLPEAAAVAAEIRRLASRLDREVRIRESRNVNLKLWFVLYFLYLAGGNRARKFIGHTLLVLLPVLKHCNFGRTYRRIFFVRLD